jgi:hypothetical protein
LALDVAAGQGRDDDRVAGVVEVDLDDLPASGGDVVDAGAVGQVVADDAEGDAASPVACGGLDQTEDLAVVACSVRVLFRQDDVPVVAHDFLDVGAAQGPVVDDELDASAGGAMDIAEQADGGGCLGTWCWDVAGGKVDALVEVGAAGVPADVAVGQDRATAAVVFLQVGIEAVEGRRAEQAGAGVGVGDRGGAVVVGDRDGCRRLVEGAYECAVAVGDAGLVGMGQRPRPVGVEQADAPGGGDRDRGVLTRQQRDALVGGQVVIAQEPPVVPLGRARARRMRAITP